MIDDGIAAGASRSRPPLHEPIVMTSLGDEIAFQLQAAIVDGTYRSGSYLRQEELCQRFNVSRTPVREALRKLQAQNLVAMTPNKGATVTLPTRKDIQEIYVMRAELEGFACELAAAASVPQTWLAELEQAQGLVERATTELEHRPTDAEHGYYFVPLFRANDSFHEIIHRMAGNSRLRATIVGLTEAFPKNLVWRAMRSLNENRSFVIGEHQTVLEALRRGDGTAARDAMSGHVLHAGQVLLAYLDARQLWDR